MDLEAAIHQLKTRKQKLDFAIAELEQLQRTKFGGNALLANRAGRKSMDSEERGRVSQRMRRYWANRRGPIELTKG